MATSYLPNFSSATLGVVLDKLADFMLKEASLIWNANDVMKKLERTLLRVQTLLDDVELSHRTWQIWLSDLKVAAYEADDLLDEISLYASSRNKSDQRLQADGNQVRASDFALPSYISAIPHKMDSIQKKIDEIAKEIEHLRINKFQVKQRLSTSSLMYEPHVLGRDNEMRTLKRLLLSAEPAMENVSVVSVVGMAGIGKTTIAQLVYNDADVCAHFQLRMWISVPHLFDVRTLTKSILESATHNVIEVMDLDLLQVKLQRKLDNQRFLLVLDDVRSESHKEWDVLEAPLKIGARGSRIIVTTQSHIVSNIMNSYHEIRLASLPIDDCCSLFERKAFGITNPENHPNLVVIGREIVRKCKGLPLAVKTLASVLKSRRDEDRWNTILQSEIWDFSEEQNGILSALRLSYQYLPTYLKPCFAFCAAFPKGYKFDKEKLVLLWMAVGFIQPIGRRRMEDVGSDYFDLLLARSFFQDGHVDPEGNPRYLMHDLIHDLAKFVMNDEHFGMEDDGKSHKPSISKHVRHLSCLSGSVSATMFDALYDFQSLRTMLLLSEGREHIDKVPAKLFVKLKCLRVLDLSGTCITELPFSVGNLKLLRYLNLSRTFLQSLHPNVCILLSLQTLKLGGCKKLLSLPKDMINLVNLRHLELETNPSMHSMPANISNLTALQTLTFVVSTKEFCKIQELQNIKNLRVLCISKLQNVADIKESWGAKLNEKQYLHKLKLQWSVMRKGSVDEGVLAGLQPHKNIKEVQIDFYPCSTFPSWMSDSSFCALTKLSLRNCHTCKHLPPLGQLPALKSLFIADMPVLECVERSFYGVAGSIRGFPSLEMLEFNSMDKFGEWDVAEGDLPRLCQLIISRCRHLTVLPAIQFLHSLEHLEFSHCSTIRHLQNEAIPRSLKSLTVKSSPILRNWYETEGLKSFEDFGLSLKVTLD